MRVGLAVHLHQRLGEAGAQHQHVAGFHRDPLFVHRGLQLRQADRRAAGAEGARQVQQHATALHAFSA